MKKTKILLYVGHWMPVFYAESVKTLIDAGVSEDAFENPGKASTAWKLKGKTYVLGTSSDAVIVAGFEKLSKTVPELENFEIAEVPAGDYAVLTYDGAEFLVPSGFVSYGSPGTRLERSTHRKSSEVSVAT